MLGVIPLRIFPVHGSDQVIVASVRTGSVMGESGCVGESPVKLFDNEEQAKGWCLALPQEFRKYIFVKDRFTVVKESGERMAKVIDWRDGKIVKKFDVLVTRSESDGWSDAHRLADSLNASYNSTKDRS